MNCVWCNQPTSLGLRICERCRQNSVAIALSDPEVTAARDWMRNNHERGKKKTNRLVHNSEGDSAVLVRPSEED